MTDKQGFLAVTFQLRGTWCGVDTLQVQEVVKLARITPVHHARPYVAGVLNLRGKILTVIDLAQMMNGDSISLGVDSRVIIYPWRNEQLGILVDRVGDVVQVEAGSLSERPSVSDGIAAEFFAGVLSQGDRLVGILQIDKILASDPEVLRER